MDVFEQENYGKPVIFEDEVTEKKTIITFLILSQEQAFKI